MENITDYIIPATILLVVGITILVIFGIWKIGKFLFEQKFFGRKCESQKCESYLEKLVYWFKDHNNYNTNRLLNILNNLQSDHTEKRNEYWTIYGQIVICIFIVCTITLLLLTKVISPEAGLPIISAISGFAIAKSSTMKNNNNSDNNLNNG